MVTHGQTTVGTTSMSESPEPRDNEPKETPAAKADASHKAEAAVAGGAGGEPQGGGRGRAKGRKARGRGGEPRAGRDQGRAGAAARGRSARAAPFAASVCGKSRRARRRGR